MTRKTSEHHLQVLKGLFARAKSESQEALAPAIRLWSENSLQNKYADLMEDYEVWKDLHARYGHINHLIDEVNDTNWLLTGNHNHLEQEEW